MRCDVIVVHYVCRGLFDERFVITNGPDLPSTTVTHPSIEMPPIDNIRLTSRSSGPRFIIGECKDALLSRVGASQKRAGRGIPRPRDQKRFFFPHGKSLHVRILVRNWIKPSSWSMRLPPSSLIRLTMLFVGMYFILSFYNVNYSRESYTIVFYDYWASFIYRSPLKIIIEAVFIQEGNLRITVLRIEIKCILIYLEIYWTLIYRSVHTWVLAISSAVLLFYNDEN